MIRLKCVTFTMPLLRSTRYYVIRMSTSAHEHISIHIDLMSLAQETASVVGIPSLECFDTIGLVMGSFTSHISCLVYVGCECIISREKIVCVCVCVIICTVSRLSHCSFDAQHCMLH